MNGTQQQNQQLQAQVNEDFKVKYEVDGVEIVLTPAIVQNYIVGSAAQITPQEFKLFTELCRARKLNPFLREAYCIKFGNEAAQIVVGKDAIVKRAVKNKQYNGMESGIFVLNEKGEVIERKGTFKLPTETLVGGWARVYRKDWEYPLYMSVSFDEVAQRKGNGELNRNWAGKGATMVEKVAKVRALREAFVEDLGGMIDEDEAWENRSTDLNPPMEIIPQTEPTTTTTPNTPHTEPAEVNFDEL